MIDKKDGKITSKHLTKEERIKLGSYYTPEELVEIVAQYVKPYKAKHQKNIVIADTTAGMGAFSTVFADTDYRLADMDEFVTMSLGEKFDARKIFLTNALIGVERKKFQIDPESFLIVVGNPPYNDTTSEFRSGRKGDIVSDPDLFDRDMGISFLKSYDKLNANVVCVLHPLSYLIKKANFNRLGLFKDNYRLRKSTLFPSSVFPGTGKISFPISVSLYEKDEAGMPYEHITRFSFQVNNSADRFSISKFTTTDGYINKYPPRSLQDHKSPIGIYYYTFRDINSLKKNTSFLDRVIPNGIVVDLDNIYQYAYLYYFKEFFNPINSWLYGNLSPLVDISAVEKHKDKFVNYALINNKVLLALPENLKNKIRKFYNISKNQRVIKQHQSVLNSILEDLTKIY